MNRYARTALSVQSDTLDAIAYRFFGSESNRYLPQLIELNDQFSPFAILPMRSQIVLPDTPTISPLNTIKLWD